MVTPSIPEVLAYVTCSQRPWELQLVTFAGPFSARARQIGRNVERYEAEWREAHPGAEPGRDLLRTWDRRAWSQARPDKVIPTDGTTLTDRWVDELHQLGFRSPTRSVTFPPHRTGALDRDKAVATVLSRLGNKRSAWNAADVRGQVEPEHIRSLTSREVIAVEADLVSSFALRASLPGLPASVHSGNLDDVQRHAVAALAGTYRLVVVEGAAGAGKTTALAAASIAVAHTNQRMLVVTPTLKAAQVAATEIGSPAYSAAWLTRQYGFTFDDDGKWSRQPSDPSAEASLSPGDLLLVDEAGMLDQDTARALTVIADETGARLALVGDRHQLPAVGRGGVLDLAARWVDPVAAVTLDNVHRFADPEYAALSLDMRSGENPDAVFDQLVDRGQIALHPDESSRTAALADEASATGALVVADTREQVTDLNQAIRDRLVTAGRVDDSRAMVTDAGDRIGLGDRVATRFNDYRLGVANRDTWTVTAIREDGTLCLDGNRGTRDVPPQYARRSIELAYASTVYGTQGDTTHTAHLALGEHTGAASAYVAMTRGREANTAHLVAADLDAARQQWVLAFARNRADLGPAYAARLAFEEADKYEPYIDRRERRTEVSPAIDRARKHISYMPQRPRSGPSIGF